VSSSGGDSSVVTAVIAAHDESANIQECIVSVRWAREVIVVENDSADDTIAVARTAGATVISPHFTTIGAARNQGIERAETEWILVLDADERCTPELAQEIEQTVQRTDLVAFRIPRRNFFLGKEIRHGGWESDKPVRLFRRELRYNANMVHEHVDVPAMLPRLQAETDRIRAGLGRLPSTTGPAARELLTAADRHLATLRDLTDAVAAAQALPAAESTLRQEAEEAAHGLRLYAAAYAELTGVSAGDQARREASRGNSARA